MERRRIIPLIGVFIFIIALVGVLVGENIKKHTPSKKHISEAEIKEMFGVDDENMPVVLNDVLAEGKAYEIDGQTYLGYSFVKEKLNKKFYWDNNENYLIYTTPTEIIKAELGTNEYFVNKAKKQTDYQIVKTNGDQVYVNLEFVKQFTAMETTVLDSPKRVCIISNYGKKIKSVTATKSGQIRQGTSIKDKIVYDVNKEDTMIVVKQDENQDEDWLKVSVNGGYTGYIKKSILSEEQELVRKTDFKKPEYDSISKDGTICMAWHMVTSEAANATIFDVTANAKGLNVISPTWFRICDDDGNISSIADSLYVQRAHQMGIDVWAMVDDQSPDSNDANVFPYTSKRENLENQLVAAAIEYGLDGINIDFEHIKSDFADDYIQFIRELSVKCRINGIVLSIDTYANASMYDYFNCEEQGELADYIVIMSYDEHYSGSKEAGSVASLSWVKEGIEGMLEKVPSEKIVNGMPFYTRIWEEKDGKLSSRALGMEDSWNEMNLNNAETIWVEDFGQTYAEYERDGATYRSWLEDAKSTEERMKLIGEYGLAGVSCWRLGFETADVWNTIVKYVN